MQLFEITCLIKHDGEEKTITKRVLENKLNECDYSVRYDDANVMFVTSYSNDKLSLCYISKRDNSEVKSNIENYLTKLGLDVNKVTVKTEETSVANCCELYKKSEMNGYVNQEIKTFFNQLQLRYYLAGHDGFSSSENMLTCLKKAAIYKDAEKYSTQTDLKAELDRIYATKKMNNFVGHPAHYFVITDNVDSRRESCKLLLNALYEKNRIISKRYTFLNIYSSDYSFEKHYYENIYKLSVGGAVIVRIDKEDVEGIDQSTIGYICAVMNEYRNDVLTIFCLPNDSNLKDLFINNLLNRKFVTIKESNSLSFADAKKWLLNKAEEKKMKVNDKLFSMLEEGKSYPISLLKFKFNDWYDGIIDKCFLEYENIQTNSAVKSTETLEQLYESLDDEVEEKKEDTYTKLMSMTGISSAKEVATKAINLFKAQKLFKDKGFNTDKVSMHMIFTGNPGTCKTTFARMFAQIMSENGILEKGHLVEVGREGLVGKYVGNTAPKVKEKFKEAKGGILFIDEAYSLVDDRDGLYGDEAINTIVQEMENNREDTIVVFAGYPDKMQAFLNKNPGLKSRIAFHINFEDYSVDELCEIAKYMCKEQGLVLSDDAIEKLRENVEEAKTVEGYGNGRYVRNVLENAKIEHATRLLKIGADNVTPEDIVTLTKDDIKECTLIRQQKTQAKKRIGFGA